MANQPAASVALPDQPMDCCFHPSEPVLASALVNGQVLLHRYAAEPAGKSQQQELGYEAASCSYAVQQVLCRDSKKAASCRAVVFSSTGSDLICGFETGTILQLDPATGKAKSRLTKAHSAGINRLIPLPDSPYSVAAGDNDGAVYIWDLRSQQTVYKYSKHKDFVSCMTVSDKHQALLAVSGDGTLSVHDLKSSKALAHSETDADDELLSVAVVKGGKKVVCGSQSGVLAIWSWGYWNDCSDRLPGHPESVDAIIKWDEDTIVTGSSDGALRVINILPNKLLGVVGEHSEDMPVERLALSADKQLLASMSHDSCVKLWDMSILQDDGEGEQGEEEEEQDIEQQQQAAGSQQQTMASEAAARSAAAGSSSASAAASKRQQLPGVGSSDESDGDDSDADSDSDQQQQQQQRSKKKRSKHEKTAMKGSGKHSKAGNFFAGLL